jgi:hypothetical protein
LTEAERELLDRVGDHLSDAGVWEPPPIDGQFRLLAAAAEESRLDGRPVGSIDLTDSELPGSSAPAESAESAEPAEPVAPVRPLSPVPSGEPGSASATPPGEPGFAVADSPDEPVVRLADGSVDDDAANVIQLPERRGRGRGRGRGGSGGGDRRAAWFGAGAVVAAAAAVVALAATGRLGSVAPDTGVDSELAVAATHELTPTALDPDVEATVDVIPTPAGVELRLQLKALDNAEGDDYYAAWLAGPGELIPLGTFHWRAGGVEIVLWSGVDDPAYDQLLVTRQTVGDGAGPSDQVVLTGTIPDLAGG